VLIDDNAKDIPRTPVPSIVPYSKLFGATRNSVLGMHTLFPGILKYVV